jgi:WD40 repeat protein
MEVAGQAVVAELKHRRREDIDAGGAAIADVAAAPDGETFAVCFERTLLVAPWNPGGGVEHFDAEAPIDAVAFSPDSARLALAGADGRVRIFEREAGRVVTELQGEHEGHHDVAWSPTGQVIAAGHHEPFVTLFDAGSGGKLAALDPKVFSDEGRTAVAFRPDGGVLASTAASSILQWSLPRPVPPGGRGVKRRKLGLKDYAFFVDVAFSGAGDTLAALAETEGEITLHFYQMPDGKKRGHIALPHFSQRLAWSADDAFIAVIENDAPGVSLWDPERLDRSETTIEGAMAAMTAIAAHPRRSALVAGSDNGQVFVWEPVGA